MHLLSVGGKHIQYLYILPGFTPTCAVDQNHVVVFVPGAAALPGTLDVKPSGGEGAVQVLPWH